ncbi:MAG: hypothetical protein UV82_C0010G0033 [Candidatus Magasanikbacteria bacterium GW2011_GWD2_43_18]|uniref:Uncharacterized protein n=1 Tax=Candidatus Magasanikbacteria bacterium GW2011_GWE2_42_7 TaxID=1619052 RepID=A0A0G1BF44_9BACT|nr:MAG: hypothetical protein UV18_C0005G0150 [Candidatus Magasanikbacteria bacterium GW2011_GWC2_42_27]KKS71799.1 MAG: hypothetical protein UV42_C0019G0023 [Candidatus Magasanikbacteria bacterium GW2011_GWE2_42_7]KKT04217.1 MAG: hypothetical protein UV82_C0010G0033 [Candidatus Magasanikbacteria bacterium GW2011_GWD2_43_18]KKT25911.1 MAG: hypothetical protein UW10_C0003G0072 [Candidatus Magasanikbacteria bacterium GW2011_GWA2_43_9]
MLCRHAFRRTQVTNLDLVSSSFCKRTSPVAVDPEWLQGGADQVGELVLRLDAPEETSGSRHVGGGHDAKDQHGLRVRALRCLRSTECLVGQPLTEAASAAADEYPRVYSSFVVEVHGRGDTLNGFFIQELHGVHEVLPPSRDVFEGRLCHLLLILKWALPLLAQDEDEGENDNEGDNKNRCTHLTDLFLYRWPRGLVDFITLRLGDLPPASR